MHARNQSYYSADEFEQAASAARQRRTVKWKTAQCEGPDVHGGHARDQGCFFSTHVQRQDAGAEGQHVVKWQTTHYDISI
jgi:hypothetical protein